MTLPAPTGGYRAGRVTFDWTDHARTDPLAPRPGVLRELAVWLWYPASPDARGPRAPYAPGAWGRLHFGSLPGWGESSFGAVRTHALDGVPVAADRFPIVVLEPGLGLAAPQHTTLAGPAGSLGTSTPGVPPTSATRSGRGVAGSLPHRPVLHRCRRPRRRRCTSTSATTPPTT